MTEIIRRRKADEDNEVVSLKGGNGAYRKEPCEECPWRRENDGSFPAEAFRLSAPTSYDQATHVFGCHMSGKERPADCAGAVLGSPHNLGIRMKAAFGKIDLDKVVPGDADLHPNYRSMAEANGVDPDDPVLEQSR